MPELVYDLLKFGIALTNDFFQPYRSHTSFLKLRERPSRFHRLMLSRVAYEQHPVIRMKPGHEFVDLPRRCKRRFVHNVKASLAGVRLLTSRKVPLQCRCFDTGLGEPLRGGTSDVYRFRFFFEPQEHFWQSGRFITKAT